MTSNKVKRFNWTDNSSNYLKYCETQGYSVYFIGGTTEIIDKAVANISKQFPRLTIAGWNNGYEDLYNTDIINKVNSISPNIVWVGLGSPRQELWIAENTPKLNFNVIQAVGDIFSYYAGTKRRGPKIIRKIGLEWFIRLIYNPTIYWKRYLLGIPKFIFIILKERFTKDD